MKRQTSFHLGVLAVLAGVALLAAGCGSIVVGSGELVTREYDFQGFSLLDVSQRFEVEVTRGDTHAVRVTVDDNLVERLRVRLDGDTLRIGLQGATASQGTTQRATVMLPELGGSGGDASLEASGASSLELGGLELASARVSLSGASRATVLASGTLDADLSGASSLSYAGHPSLGRVETSGASQIRPLAP